MTLSKRQVSLGTIEFDHKIAIVSGAGRGIEQFGGLDIIINNAGDGGWMDERGYV